MILGLQPVFNGFQLSARKRSALLSPSETLRERVRVASASDTLCRRHTLVQGYRWAFLSDIPPQTQSDCNTARLRAFVGWVDALGNPTFPCISWV